MDTETRIGWGNTCVAVGEPVRIRRHYGRGASGVVTELLDYPNFGYVMVRIEKISERYGSPGQIVKIFSLHLEGIATT